MNDTSSDFFDSMAAPPNSTNLDFADFALRIAELTAKLLADKKVDELVALDGMERICADMTFKGAQPEDLEPILQLMKSLATTNPQTFEG